MCAWTPSLLNRAGTGQSEAAHYIEIGRDPVRQTRYRRVTYMAKHSTANSESRSEALGRAQHAP